MFGPQWFENTTVLAPASRAAPIASSTLRRTSGSVETGR